MRLGRVGIEHGYTVDFDDKEMVDQAKACLYEDIMNAYKTDEMYDWICVLRDKSLEESDVPDFLREDALERQEEQRRDEKRGLYPDKEDCAN